MSLDWKHVIIFLGVLALLGSMAAIGKVTGTQVMSAVYVILGVGGSAVGGLGAVRAATRARLEARPDP